MGSYYKCERCGNDDPNKIGWLNNKPYCRKCVCFHGASVSIKKSDSFIPSTIYLDYSLTKEQQIISDALIQNYMMGKSSLVHAVCGSGKTEIVLALISYVLSQGGSVGFAIPRRDVVIEIFDRLKNIFKDNSVIAVYGGHTDQLEGDIICLTTHQLYRYEKYFDLLILDEIDAFPFLKNDVLNAMFFRAIRGYFVQMSATPSDEVINFFKRDGFDILTLDVRHHRYPLPIPEIHIKRLFMKYVFLYKVLQQFEKENRPVFVFCPTIASCESTYNIYRFLFKKVNYVHSKREKREEIIQAFKKGEIKILFTTSVLERGVTIKDLQVIIFHADHALYDKSTLIQISGRVGRKKDAPNGKVIFICDEFNQSMQECIHEIKRSNTNLQNMLSANKDQQSLCFYP